MIYLRMFVGTKSLDAKECTAGIYPKITPPVSLFQQHCFLLKLLWQSLSMEVKSHPTIQNLLIYRTRKTFLLNVISPLSKVSFLFKSNSNFYVNILYKLLHLQLYSLLLYHYFNFKRFLHICHPNLDKSMFTKCCLWNKKNFNSLFECYLENPAFPNSAVLFKTL